MHTCNLYRDTTKLDFLFLNVNYVKSPIRAPDTGELFRQQFRNLIWQWRSLCDTNVLVTTLYVQITEPKRKLFNRKRKKISNGLVILWDLDFWFLNSILVLYVKLSI